MDEQPSLDKQAYAMAGAATRVCEAYIDEIERNKKMREYLNIFFDRYIHIVDNYGYWDHDKQIRIIPVSAIDKWVEEFQDALKEV